MSRFDYFVLLAEMRTGSNFLETNLNLIDGITCHGEAFNPTFIGHPKADQLLGIDIASREDAPQTLLDRIRDSDQMGGFRLFHDHDARVANTCLHDPRCAKIILTRNPVDSFVSWKIAQVTGQWKLTNAAHAKAVTVEFDMDGFERHLATTMDFAGQVRRILQTTGQTAFYVDYDDLRDVDVINGIAAYLGITGRLPNVNKKLKKQNPAPLDQKVSNFDQMQEALRAKDWFALWRSPQFEPQRGPAIPSYVAAPKTGLLYVPLRSGPDRAVRDWLTTLDGGDVQEKFTQRSLRDWMETHRPHRSFAVLRHPVARAHAVFCDRILPVAKERYADIRANLQRVHKLPLPAGTPDFAGADGYDIAAHRAAFLGFLDFLKVNLAGQTSIRVDPSWASQHSLLQGISQFSAPDCILREHELPEALPRLAQSVGRINPPAYRAVDHARAPQLIAIYDSEVELAARQAYARDYQIFGFGDWA